MSDPDTIHFSCPHCGKRLRVKLHLAGKHFCCPNQACGRSLEVPARSEDESRGTTHPPNHQARHLDGRNAAPPHEKKDEVPKTRPARPRTITSPVAICGGLAGLIVLAGIVTFVNLRLPGEQQNETAGSEPSASVDEPANAVVPSRPPRLPPSVELLRVEPAEPRVKEVLQIWLRGDAADGSDIEFQYRTNPLDNWQSAPGGLVLISAVKAGQLTLQFRSVDSTGTPSPTIERSWNVKELNRPPTVAIARVEPAKPEINGSIRLELSGEDPDGDALTFRYRTSPTADWRNADGGKVVLSDLKAGDVWVQVQARDRHGLASEPLTRTWSIAAAGTIVTSTPVRTFKGHRACAHAVAFTPDGGKILSGSCDGTLRLWDTHTADLLTDFAGVQGGVFAVVISPDGRFAVCGGAGRGGREPPSLQVWNLASCQELRRMTGHSGYITCLTISPDGKRVASGATDTTVRLWDVATGREIHCFRGHKTPVRTVAFAPDGGKLLSAGGSEGKDGEPVDCALRLWDIATERQIASLPGHSHRVSSVAFLSDARSAISSSGRMYQEDARLAVDPFVRLWNLELGKEERRFMGGEEGVASVLVTFDKKYIFCACGDDKMHLLELKTGRELQRYEGHRKKVLCVAISRNSHHVVTGSEDGKLLLWDLPKEVHIPLEFLTEQHSPGHAKE